MTSELFQEFHKDLVAFLHQEDRLIPIILIELEQATGKKREHIFYGLVLALAIFLIHSYGAELLCNTIGVAYPVIASLEAIETVDKDDDTHWLTYWTVYGAVSLIGFICDKMMGTSSIYWLAKCIFLLWLYMPYFRGAQTLHKNYLGPLFRRWRPHLRAAAAEVNQKAQNIVGDTSSSSSSSSDESEQSENEQQPAPA